MIEASPRTVSQVEVEPLLKVKGFKKDKIFTDHFTRGRWWHFWNIPNGGDLLIVGQYAWTYTKSGVVSGTSGYSTQSLKDFLELML